MKTLRISILILFLGQTNSSFSQWHAINSGTTTNLIDIRFVSDSIGYILSSNGQLLKTNDEGNTWSIINTLNGNFTSLANVGIDTIFAGGDKLYRSINGGNTWDSIYFFGYTMIDMEFFTAQRGVIIKPEIYTCNSSQGTVDIDNYKAYQSSDSGFSWQLAFGSLIPTSRFQLINDSTAYVAGGNYSIFDHCHGIYVNNGMRTVSGGILWTSSAPPGQINCNFSFTNDSSGYIMAINYGTGWNLWRMEDSVMSIVRSMTIAASQIVSINKIDNYILSGNNIYLSKSEGLVWNLDTLPGSFTLNKIWNDYKWAMFAIGVNGIILKKQIIETLRGVTEIKHSNKFSIYPNPANNFIQIIPSTNCKNLTAKLYNILGLKVFENDCENISSSFQMDVSRLGEGIYLLKLTTEDGSFAHKIIINK